MTAVRPPAFPPIRPAVESAAGRTDVTKLAAQRAFFQAALGHAAPAAPSAAPAVAVSAAAAAPTRIPEPGAEKPQKILRPGSLLDIRV